MSEPKQEFGTFQVWLDRSSFDRVCFTIHPGNVRISLTVADAMDLYKGLAWAIAGEEVKIKGGSNE